MNYYYTRWRFKITPDGLDGVGPYHSTYITSSNPQEFIAKIHAENLAEFFYKQFETQEEMEKYWVTIHKESGG